MDRDFSEMLNALSDEEVESLVVGAYAVAARGLPRATGDIDLWVRSTPETFTQPDVVYQIDLPPNRIAFLTTIDGVECDEAWRERVEYVVENVSFQMLSKRHLLANKRAIGRPQDLPEVARLEKL